MALKDINTFGELALEWGVSVDTIYRWFKYWAPILKLKVKRPSGRYVVMVKSEAERWWKAMDCSWDDGKRIRRERHANR